MTGKIHLSLRRAGPNVLLCFALAGLGCSAADPNAARIDEAAQVSDEVGNISGRYDLSGVTSTPGTDQSRRIGGSMVIRQMGDAYTASYEFETLFPGENKPVEAHIIGVGEGQLDGLKMLGTARTQIVVSTVPGVDPAFAFIPRGVTTRIVSESVGLVSPDGSISVDIISRAAEGETYTSTRTRMTGIRIDDLTPKVAVAEID
jgi:hypothetical protein